MPETTTLKPAMPIPDTGATKPTSESSKEEILARDKGRVMGPPIDRRGFFVSLAAAWGAFTLAVGGLSAAIFAFMVPRVDWGKSTLVQVGPPDRFAPNSVDETFKLSDRLWIVRENEEIVALLAVCTHLGCTPNWLEAENKFKCPCHGSGFRGPEGGQLAGINFEGPAPYPLWRCKIWLAEDGQIMVDKGQLYGQQKGEWDKPDSFLRV